MISLDKLQKQDSEYGLLDMYTPVSYWEDKE